jgi:uncharacterized damage-inducible protein DinB
VAVAKRDGERLEKARALHLAAADELYEVASRVPPERWRLPREEGKWSPAHIVSHLNRTYDILLAELDGGPGMQVRTRPIRRLLLRLFLVPRLLRGDGFPAGAPAPRETRPGDEIPEQEVALAAFQERAARLEGAVDLAWREGRHPKLTHAYFGSASMVDGVLLCARHLEHHCAQLRALAEGD